MDIKNMNYKELLAPTPKLAEGQVAEVGNRSRMIVGLAAIILGMFGIHHFILGFKQKGIFHVIACVVSQLLFVAFVVIGMVLTMVTLVLGVPFFILAGLTIVIDMVLGIKSLVEGILIFTNKDYLDADGKLLKD
ncbi:MAG: hypothetical protein FWC70_06370 [Defluviitaleaceae bacterium]|nr:hypothetical protein [Defluviitaleaceae bacterium]